MIYSSCQATLDDQWASDRGIRLWSRSFRVTRCQATGANHWKTKRTKEPEAPRVNSPRQLKSRRRTCYENSMMEVFFNTIKSELIWPVAWQSRQSAENAIARYINGFCTPIRPHSTLGYKSPIAFARKAREVSQSPL